MANFIVTTGGDFVDETDGVLSLREAIAAAAATPEADIITFADNVSVATLQGSANPLQVFAGGQVTILGDRDGDGIADVTISGGDTTYHFLVNGDASLALEGLRLADGFDTSSASGAGISARDTHASIVNGGELSLTRVVFQDNVAVGGDGTQGFTGGAGNSPGNPDGGAGNNGGGGGLGGRGGEGGDAAVIFNTGTITFTDTGFDDGNDLDGGFGGRGGTGGRGGNGGDGAFNLFGGNPGGNGGNGGRGGTGGNGGDAAAIRNAGTISGETPVADASQLSAGGGGNGGTGGGAGSGGSGGAIGGADGSNGAAGGTGLLGAAGAVDQVDVETPGTGEIEIADTVVFVHATDLETEEGGALTFNVNRIGSSAGNFTVSWTLNPGSGLDASDFAPGTALSGTVEFVNGGPDARVVTLQTLEDGVLEPNETFSIELTEITPTSASDETVAFGTDEVGGEIAASDGGGNAGETITGTPDPDDLPGTPDDDTINALAGNDIVRGSGGSDTINGGAGQDRVVYELSRAELGVNKIGQSSANVTKPDGGDLLSGVERVEFAEGRLVFDIEAETRVEQRLDDPNYSYDEAYIYRLYDAAYARTPDELGIRFWVNFWNDDAPTAKELAEFFVESPEYQERYPDATDEAYIDQLYENALRRDPDPAGEAFWLAEFQSGRQDRADMLAFFAESPENIERNAENTDDGLFFLPTDGFDVETLV